MAQTITPKAAIASTLLLEFATLLVAHPNIDPSINNTLPDGWTWDTTSSNFELDIVVRFDAIPVLYINNRLFMKIGAANGFADELSALLIFLADRVRDLFDSITAGTHDPTAHTDGRIHRAKTFLAGVATT